MRDASHLKLANAVMQDDRDVRPEEENRYSVPDVDWREELLKNSTTEEAEPTSYSDQTEVLQKPTETIQQTSHTKTPTKTDCRPAQSPYQPSKERPKRQRSCYYQFI